MFNAITPQNKLEFAFFPSNYLILHGQVLIVISVCL